ncbi:glycosyltransferase [Polaribacter sp. Hel_I_88]|uniref:glycosyltransferase n=1 Tax=Polaribacter sp. Hel_I_88 TaxID=1250006 RepID=UPI00047C2A6A|nr:glycosyltransferase [Polaribacter sp. Hel_I_88]
MIITVVFYVFVAFTGIQILYYLIFSSFLFKQKKKANNTEKVPVSLIVFAKNSATNLQQNLPNYLAQDYPEFEIVLIDNASSDDTEDVIESFVAKHKNIKVVSVENNEAFWNNKKYALTLGIKAAKYDHLLFSNINSSPINEHWVTEMSKKFTLKKTIILGYEKYKKENSIKNLFIRFHRLLKAIQCFAFAKQGSPFMAFGNNLAYKKTEFFKVNGFIKHIKIKFAEDDLFIKDAATKENISYAISKNSFVETDAPKSFNDWFQEQRLLSSIEEHFKFKNQFFLNLFFISKLLFYVLGAILFFLYPWQIILGIVLGYFLVQYIIIGLSAKKLQEPQIIFFLPLLEISLLLIQISIFIANLISKPNHWR